jgi:pSer/pThr/pTyr-binding forkhead associated (FHA) protein
VKVSVRPSYLLSYIAIQRSRLSEAQFSERFGGAWLVWEPGTWQPPSKQLTVTLGASRGPPTAPSQTDALCFSLGETGSFRVGRAPDNDCVVSDATVSRYHCEILFRDGAWRVRSVDGRLVGLNHRPIPGETKLSPHDRLYLGDVTLTFEDAFGLTARFKA